jgi:transcriptional regulator with XRE-family HTH domain
VPRPRKSPPRSPELAALGEAIRQLRTESNLSQEDLADLLGTEFSRVGLLERGHGNPSYTTLLRVARALKTQVGVLTTLADQIYTEHRPE